MCAPMGLRVALHNFTASTNAIHVCRCGLWCECGDNTGLRYYQFFTLDWILSP